ncbi:LTA synthase family protein [Paenibacillus silviterrae]|uniref:LTA synthase family protein n=1 Tax=Paenibacillus silviterrae TaxID=3242194 RepID=UPI0025432EA2|nr:LTA synthase family protein [Paenibacillus chinjuensis]
MGDLQLLLRETGLRAARRLPLFLWSVWIVLLVELLSRGQWGAAFSWTFHKIPELSLNALVVLSLMLLFTSIISNVRISFWLVATVCLAFGLISGVKLSILGVPFVPWDLLLTSETKDMAQYIGGLLNFTTISGLLSFIGISLLLLYKLPPVRLVFRWKQRLIMGVSSLILLSAIYSDDFLSLKKMVNVQNLAWDQTENVKTNGFLLSTIMNLKFLIQKEPDDYNEESIRSIASSIPPVVTEPGEKKPNIIVVLSESLFDITQIKSLKFSQDPLPFYHSLMEKYTSGTMLSPQFGGGTANVEFEVLTGNTMRFLPQGSVPYNQYVDKGIDSLASILARQGYETTAINPFHSWFYNSKHVYENMGFAKYISQEFFEPDYEGPYIADRAVAKYITETTSSTSGPDFIFANTMENHYHYYPGKFEKNTIEVTGVTESKGLFETYAQGLLGVDDMLKRLVTYYENSNEPTILLFFGDHLPSLGDDYLAYKESGYLKENDPDFVNKMHRVPVLIWDNYLPRDRKEHINMDTSLIGSYLLKLAERPGSYYTDFLYHLSQQTPILPSKQESARDERMKVYEKLQYDILFGKQYAYGDMKNNIKKENYVIGLGKMYVRDVKLEGSGSEQTLKVQGENLPYGSILQVNGQPLETKWLGTGEITAVVKKELLTQAPMRIEILVKDSKDAVVGKSNDYVYTGTSLTTAQPDTY